MVALVKTENERKECRVIREAARRGPFGTEIGDRSGTVETTASNEHMSEPDGFFSALDRCAVKLIHTYLGKPPLGTIVLWQALWHR